MSYNYDHVNISFARVDNRLIHGQVGMVWTNLSGANLILVVDDKVATDAFQQELMKMTVATTGVGIRFWGVQQTIDNVWKAAPSQKIFIVTRDPLVMNQLVQVGIPIKAVNLGNMHSSTGKWKYVNEYLYVDDADLEAIEGMKAKGVEVSAQILPEHRKIIV